MHYCFFSSGSWEKNGTFLRIARLSAALAHRGVRTTVLLDRNPYNCGDGIGLHQAVERILVEPGSRLRKASNRRKLLRKLCPDFVHILSPNVSAFLTFAGFDEFRLVADWDEWPARRPYISLGQRLMFSGIDRWLQRRAALCIVASRAMQRDFEAHFGTKPLYLPHASFMESHADGESPFAQPTAVYMGNFYPAYDHDIIFHAAKILKARGFQPRIEMLAAGPGVEEWQNWVKQEQLDNISLPGYLEGADLWRRLRHAHVLLFPLRESDVNRYRCPGKIFFYAQVKRPTILSDVGENRELMRDKGIYSATTPEAFADTIETVMKQAALPDVDYGLGGWDDRATTLLNALPRVPTPAESNA